MNQYISHIVPQIAKRLMLIVVLGVAVFLNSCKEEEKPMDLFIHSHVQFASIKYKIPKTMVEPLVVSIPFTRALEEKATLVLTVNELTTAANTEYTISPAAVNGVVTINLEKGVTSASFSVTSAHNFDQDKALSITLSTTGALVATRQANATVVNNLITTIKLKGNRIPSPVLNSTTATTANTALTSLADFGKIDKGIESASKSYRIAGVDIDGDLLITASANFKVSTDNVKFASTATVLEDMLPATVYVKFAPATGVDQTLTGTIISSFGTTTNTVTVSGIESGNTKEVPILEENFEYGATAGDLTTVSAAKWLAFSGNGLFPVQYVNPSLTFAGYIGSGKGGAASMVNGSGSREDVSISFPSQSTCILYTAQMVNVYRAIGSVSDFFYCFRDGSGTFNRLYAQDNGSGKLILSLGRNTAPTASTKLYDYSKTYLIVIKYNFTTQTSNMYVLDGAIPTTEPATADVTTNGGTAPTLLKEVAIRQSDNVLDATVDGIRIATTWKGVLGL